MIKKIKQYKLAYAADVQQIIDQTIDAQQGFSKIYHNYQKRHFWIDLMLNIIQKLSIISLWIFGVCYLIFNNWDDYSLNKWIMQSAQNQAIFHVSLWTVVFLFFVTVVFSNVIAANTEILLFKLCYQNSWFQKLTKKSVTQLQAKTIAIFLVSQMGKLVYTKAAKEMLKNATNPTKIKHKYINLLSVTEKTQIEFLITNAAKCHFH